MSQRDDAHPTSGTVSVSGRILLVDDSVEVRKGLGRLLRALGHEVIEAEDGRRAIELTVQERFDVVVSDVVMPDMDGVELLRALRAEDTALSVCLISGVPDLETAMKAVEYGALEYLVKPVETHKLEASIARAIQKSREKREDQADLQEYRRGGRSSSGLKRAGHEVWTGALISGHYRIGELIGEGGMGAVYDAVREDLNDMRVAIKIVHPQLSADRELLARFRREAAVVATIDHPNIVRIFDFQMSEEEPAILVMERLSGSSLGQRIELWGSIEQESVVFIAWQILSALAAAHRRHIIHRDLKPDNIFLTSVSGVGDIVKVLDFGIAKLLDSGEEQKLTRTGAVLGTPAYMAPEHARGAEVDARIDIYAVGCVMYEALTGRAPYVAENYNALLYAVQGGHLRPLAELRPELEPGLIEVVERAMAREASERFQRAEEMMEALSALATWADPDSSIISPPPSSIARATSDLSAEASAQLKTTRREMRRRG